MKIPPTLLLIFDGWGIAPPGEGNAISRAKTPNFDRLVTTYPTFALHASGDYVGLPWGEVGNSEVGHFNIGAGQIIYQDLPRIDRAIKDKNFFENEKFRAAAKAAKKKGAKMHLIGMFSAGKVHASDEHMIALLDFCRKEKLAEAYLHIILDGRDVERDTGREYIRKLQAFLKKSKVGKIASISGRYYAMDRDNHWERIQKAYNAMVHGAAGQTFDDPEAAVAASYAEKVYDEEFVPVVITDGGKPVAVIEAKDAVIFSNFRADRARELTMAFVLPGFEKFDRGEYLRGLEFVTMAEYDKDLPVDVAFPPTEIPHPLAWALSDNKIRQLHVAETEKYAHVTFFLNGGREDAYPGEEHLLIPSAGVADYSKKPEMSAREITKAVLGAVARDKYDFYVINFANADMVGHTGGIPATIKAVEILDDCLGQLTEAFLAKDGMVFITADHGNAEEKINVSTGARLKEHSTNPVPFIIVGKKWEKRGVLTDRDLSILQPVGVLADVTPTILTILGLPIPKEMSGQALMKK